MYTVRAEAAWVDLQGESKNSHENNGQADVTLSRCDFICIALQSLQLDCADVKLFTHSPLFLRCVDKSY